MVGGVFQRGWPEQARPRTYWNVACEEEGLEEQWSGRGNSEYGGPEAGALSVQVEQ